MKQGNESTVVSFKYDPFGRRIEKSAVRTGRGRNRDSSVHSYIYDSQALILDYEDATRHSPHNGIEPTVTKYVYGPNIDEPLAITQSNEVYFYHADGLGSIVALTDGRQKVVASYNYDSFGNIEGRVSEQIQSFTYTAREYDNETGLFYYRARYYDPMIGRFIQKDPIEFAGGDVNLYGYTYNNPVNYIDPMGLDWQLAGNRLIVVEPDGIINRYIYNAAFDEPDNPYVFKIISHGDHNSIDGLTLNKFLNKLNTKFPGILNNYSVIEIRACETGKGNNSIAEQMAKQLNKTVIAPDSSLWTIPFFIRDVNFGSWRTFYGTRGAL